MSDKGHKMGPFITRKSRFDNSVTVYKFGCSCGFIVMSPDIDESAAFAQEHLNPGMGEVTRNYFASE